MITAHLPLFAAMQPEAAAYMWSAAHIRWPHRIGPPPASAVPGEELFRVADASGLFAAELAIAVAADPAPLALQSLEQLLGRPLTRAAVRRPSPETDEALRARLIGFVNPPSEDLRTILKSSGEALDALAAAHGLSRMNPLTEAEKSSVRRTGVRERRVRDPRVVLRVQPNPRRPGSDAWAHYACWREGDTVDQCIARGLPPRYVGKSVKKGWVVLGEARK